MGKVQHRPNLLYRARLEDLASTVAPSHSKHLETPTGPVGATHTISGGIEVSTSW